MKNPSLALITVLFAVQANAQEVRNVETIIVKEELQTLVLSEEAMTYTKGVEYCKSLGGDVASPRATFEAMKMEATLGGMSEEDRKWSRILGASSVCTQFNYNVAGVDLFQEDATRQYKKIWVKASAWAVRTIALGSILGIPVIEKNPRSMIRITRNFQTETAFSGVIHCSQYVELAHNLMYNLDYSDTAPVLCAIPQK